MIVFVVAAAIHPPCPPPSSFTVQFWRFAFSPTPSTAASVHLQELPRARPPWAVTYTELLISFNSDLRLGEFTVSDVWIYVGIYQMCCQNKRRGSRRQLEGGVVRCMAGQTHVINPLATLLLWWCDFLPSLCSHTPWRTKESCELAREWRYNMSIDYCSSRENGVWGAAWRAAAGPGRVKGSWLERGRGQRGWGSLLLNPLLC